MNVRAVVVAIVLAVVTATVLVAVPRIRAAVTDIFETVTEVVQ